MEPNQTPPSTPPKARRAAKKLRNIVVSVLILIVLFAAAGFAYTFFIGGNTAKPADTPKPAANTEPGDIKPTPPAANAKVGAAIGSVMSPVAAGSNTSVNARTLAGAQCSIIVTYNGVASHDSGLETKTADAYGVVSWTWTVGSGVPAGTWPIKITCVKGAQSAVVDGSLQVTH